MKMATSIRRLRAGKGGRCSERFTGPPSFPVGRRAEGSPGVRVEGDALSRRPGACRTRAFTPAALLGARRRPAARPRVPLRSTGGAKAVAPAPLCDGDAHNVPAEPPASVRASPAAGVRVLDRATPAYPRPRRKAGGLRRRRGPPPLRAGVRVSRVRADGGRRPVRDLDPYAVRWPHARGP